VISVYLILAKRPYGNKSPGVSKNTGSGSGSIVLLFHFRFYVLVRARQQKTKQKNNGPRPRPRPRPRVLLTPQVSDCMVLPIFPILLFYDYSLQRSDFNKTPL